MIEKVKVTFKRKSFVQYLMLLVFVVPCAFSFGAPNANAPLVLPRPMEALETLDPEERGYLIKKYCAALHSVGVTEQDARCSHYIQRLDALLKDTFGKPKYKLVATFDQALTDNLHIVELLLVKISDKNSKHEWRLLDMNELHMLVNPRQYIGTGETEITAIDNAFTEWKENNQHAMGTFHYALKHPVILEDSFVHSPIGFRDFVYAYPKFLSLEPDPAQKPFGPTIEAPIFVRKNPEKPLRLFVNEPEPKTYLRHWVDFAANIASRKWVQGAHLVNGRSYVKEGVFYGNDKEPTEGIVLSTEAAKQLEAIKKGNDGKKYVDDLIKFFSNTKEGQLIYAYDKEDLYNRVVHEDTLVSRLSNKDAIIGMSEQAGWEEWNEKYSTEFLLDFEKTINDKGCLVLTRKKGPSPTICGKWIPELGWVFPGTRIPLEQANGWVYQKGRFVINGKNIDIPLPEKMDTYDRIYLSYLLALRELPSDVITVIKDFFTLKNAWDLGFALLKGTVVRAITNSFGVGLLAEARSFWEKVKTAIYVIKRVKAFWDRIRSCDKERDLYEASEQLRELIRDLMRQMANSKVLEKANEYLAHATRKKQYALREQQAELVEKVTTDSNIDFPMTEKNALAALDMPGAASIHVTGKNGAGADISFFDKSGNLFFSREAKCSEGTGNTINEHLRKSIKQILEKNAPRGEIFIQVPSGTDSQKAVAEGLSVFRKYQAGRIHNYAHINVVFKDPDGITIYRGSLADTNQND